MEQLLVRAGNISDLAFLRVLQLVHIQTSLLVEDLKQYESPSLMSRSSLNSSELSRSLSGSVASGTSTTTSISAMLETAMEELFVPYTEGQRYLERESKCLGELYSNFLMVFTRYHVRAHNSLSSFIGTDEITIFFQERVNKVKSSMFDRMMGQLNSTSTSGTSSAAAAALMRFGGYSAEKKEDKVTEEPLREEDGILSVDVAETMLKWHAEAIGRCVELSPSSDV